MHPMFVRMMKKKNFVLDVIEAKQELQDWLIMTREQKLKTLKKIEERQLI